MIALRLAAALVALLTLPAVALAQSAPEPTEDMKNAAIATSATFWAVVDSPNRSAAYELLTPEMKAEVTRDQFLHVLEDVDGKSGGVEDRRISRITWYNRANATGGTDYFAAVDFHATAPEAHTLCGYAIVHFPDGESGGIMRFEQNIIGLEAAAELTEERIALYAKAFRC